MKHFGYSKSVRIFAFSLVCITSLFGKSSDEIEKEAGRDTKIQYKSDKISAIFGGKSYLEQFGACNMTFLNSAIETDYSSYLRTTNDFYISVAYGDTFIRPRISFHNTFRFRFNWGAQTVVQSQDGNIKLANTKVITKGTSPNKHLMWSREAWVKFMLGNLDYPNNSFIQLGLINYQVGRGISLGSAYDAEGFLGFAPGFSIDQYAPAVLLSINPIPETFTFDFYTALLENNNTKFSLNSETIRSKELDRTCFERGAGRQAYIIALNNHIKLLNGATQKFFIDPYIVHQHAPDQGLEFKADADTFVTTYGCAVEADHGRFNWGFEVGRNSGENEIKPWDRNDFQITTTNEGCLVQQYTKIYTANPTGAKLKPTDLAFATGPVVAAVAAVPNNPSMNGQQIATGVLNNIDSTGTNPTTPLLDPFAVVTKNVNLYNAVDRFRPRQRQALTGYFMVADGSFKAIENVLTTSLGVGYASGFINPQQDTNVLDSAQLMNQKFTGFIPLQSTYSGKRIKHMVIFNSGIPRFKDKNPNLTNKNINITPTSQADSINEMFNIAFVGTSFDWKVAKWRSHSVEISTHIVGYWTPEVPSYVANSKDIKDAEKQLADGLDVIIPNAILQDTDAYLGTEWTTELSAMFYEKLKLYGYFGVLFPGLQYKQMCGTPITSAKLPTASDLAYVCNIGLTYAF